MIIKSHISVKYKPNICSILATAMLCGREWQIATQWVNNSCQVLPVVPGFNTSHTTHCSEFKKFLSLPSSSISDLSLVFWLCSHGCEWDQGTHIGFKQDSKKRLFSRDSQGRAKTSWESLSKDGSVQLAKWTHYTRAAPEYFVPGTEFCSFAEQQLGNSVYPLGMW